MPSKQGIHCLKKVLEECDLLHAFHMLLAVHEQHDLCAALAAMEVELFVTRFLENVGTA